MKLNLGCGVNHMPGWVNVDREASANPDVVFDVEITPWRHWETDSVDEVMFNHSLEHMGADAAVFLQIMRELYRVCRHDALVRINVPHPRHDNFIGDPTHVRIVTPQVLSLFDKQQCEEWARVGAANTPFATYLNVDFQLVEAQQVLAEPYRTQWEQKQIPAANLETLARECNNIVEELRMVLRVRKAKP